LRAGWPVILAPEGGSSPEEILAAARAGNAIAIQQYAAANGTGVAMYISSGGDVSYMAGSIHSYIVRQDDDGQWGWLQVGSVNQENTANNNNAAGDPDKKLTLEDMKKNAPPANVGYNPPKGGARKVRSTRGPSGWLDDKGQIWVPDDHKGTHAPHWDVQPEKGPGYRTVYPSATTVAEGVTFGVVLYWIISEGSRIVFPPRNFVPIP